MDTRELPRREADLLAEEPLEVTPRQSEIVRERTDRGALLLEHRDGMVDAGIDPRPIDDCRQLAADQFGWL